MVSVNCLTFLKILYLLMIYKRTGEIESFTLLGKRVGDSKDYAGEKVDITKLDLKG